jgi:hypothetical protein
MPTSLCAAGLIYAKRAIGDQFERWFLQDRWNTLRCTMNCCPIPASGRFFLRLTKTWPKVARVRVVAVVDDYMASIIRQRRTEP